MPEVYNRLPDNSFLVEAKKEAEIAWRKEDKDEWAHGRCLGGHFCFLVRK